MIGVFDSGSGGLTVLKALRRALPERDFLYFGDHARAPYGARDSEEVYRFTIEAVEFLIHSGARLIVIACNTAAAVALRRLQQQWQPMHAPDIRVLGVHVPLVEALTGQNWNLRAPAGTTPDHKGAVAIFATPRTVASNAFPTEIHLRAPNLPVLQQPCPGLADAIEAHADASTLQALVDGYVGGLMAQEGAEHIRIAALACTHYPFALKEFRNALPDHVDILTQPAMIAGALADYLARHPDMDTPGSGRLILLTSGDPDHLQGLQSRLPPEFRRFEAR